VVNDGDAAEPGTGAFLAEVGDRDEANEIVRQIIDGRPGFEDEPQPAVVLGGGERFFLPEGTPQCEDDVQPDCAVHVDPVTGDGPAREDGRNLIEEAIDDGWTVLRTREEFEALQARLSNDPDYTPKVLGLFAADDIFNDEPEEALIDAGLVDPSMEEDDKRSNLILWGSAPDTLGYNPPRADEMTEMALTILERRSEEVEQPFMLVAEVESTDNFGNNNNAIGTLNALNDANGVIEEARAFQAEHPRTLIVTAADSDAGGLQIVSPPPTDEASGNVTDVNGNPTGDEAEDVAFPVDGLYGRGSQPFRAAPDAFGEELEFAVAWIGTPDVSGGIVSRAQGLNAKLLRTTFSERYDNTDVYRHMYLTLFGELLPSSLGERAPER
jgi:alkaline phosphatase